MGTVGSKRQLVDTLKDLDQDKYKCAMEERKRCWDRTWKAEG